jgi:hypothetical protein
MITKDDECPCCGREDKLTEVFSTVLNGKAVRLTLCPRHLHLHDYGKLVLENTKRKKELENAMHCGTPININGRCAICGEMY